MFMSLLPLIYGFLSGLFTWFITALGAAVVFPFKNLSQKALDCMLGFGAGVMTAASFWSLLCPAIELSQSLYNNGWLLPALGFALGGAFVILTDLLLKRFSFLTFESQCKNGKKGARRSLLLIGAVTAHNLPEGMAVGVGIGGAFLGLAGCSMEGALMLAIGIGLQNFPEGAAVSLPLLREGFSKKKAFLYGQLSGAVEPIGAVMGVCFALAVRSFLPILLSFSAGAMIGVVSLELIPEYAQKNKIPATAGMIFGFLIMMILDITLK